NAGTDATTVVNHLRYDSFGNITSQTNSALQPLLAWTGRYRDPDTGLQWNLHRWYDPAVGRWLSEDPIGFEGRDENLARYVGNSPTTYIDPLGLDAWDPVTLYLHPETLFQNHFQTIGEAYYNDPKRDNVLGVKPGQLPVDVIREYVREHGPLDLLVIADHGGNVVDAAGRPIPGQFIQGMGGKGLSLEDFRALAPFLDQDAKLILGGCNVGQDTAYCEQIAKDTQSSVCASTGPIRYGGIPIPFSGLSIPTRFYSYDEWKWFPAPGVDRKTLPDPRQLHLRSINDPLPPSSSKKHGYGECGCH
ncbi:MAG: RHS repeat-associated core domain-containing protein, partial [Acidobacteriota bacterium]